MWGSNHDDVDVSLHDGWADRPPSDRGPHPVEEFSAAEGIEAGDVCPLSDCAARWDHFPIPADRTVLEASSGALVPASEIEIDTRGTVLCCSSRVCPLSLASIDRMREYVESLEAGGLGSSVDDS